MSPPVRKGKIPTPNAKKPRTNQEQTYSKRPAVRKVKVLKGLPSIVGVEVGLLDQAYVHAQIKQRLNNKLGLVGLAEALGVPGGNSQSGTGWLLWRGCIKAT